MFSSVLNVFFSIITFVIISRTCVCEVALHLFSPGELEYAEVVVRRAGDELALACELRGAPAPAPAHYVWNLVPAAGGSPLPLAAEAEEARSVVRVRNVSQAHAGRYMCSAPPFSQTKVVLVQTSSLKSCARGAFACGARCVLPAYVCDGRRDCARAEDEAPALCDLHPCHGPGKLNCSSGRCVPAAACCGGEPLCRQPACCEEHARHSSLRASLEEFPLPPEDRHAPDDYGFIQSTIYTVTACALIFMIAVVLLVSAVCKLHMKRHALRCARRDHGLPQPPRFPPRYEAARLLDELSPHREPERLALQCAVEAPNSPEAGFGLGRLSEIFSSRYRQVPTQCCEVEMQTVAAASAGRCELEAEFYFASAEAGQCGRDLNSMCGLEPGLGRGRGRPKRGRRPDSPNVAEADLPTLDILRLNSNDTYTLNGRTIRLLGANFENYPLLPDGSFRPPPYTEAMRYKLYGPPPEYLSRDGLNVPTISADEEARSNVEMPPNYDELAEGAPGTSGVSSSGTGMGSSDNSNGQVTDVDMPSVEVADLIPSISDNVTSTNTCSKNTGDSSVFATNNNDVCTDMSLPSTSNSYNDNNNVVESIKAVIDNLPAIDSDVNANEPEA